MANNKYASSSSYNMCRKQTVLIILVMVYSSYPSLSYTLETNKATVKSVPAIRSAPFFALRSLAVPQHRYPIVYYPQSYQPTLGVYPVQYYPNYGVIYTTARTPNVYRPSSFIPPRPRPGPINPDDPNDVKNQFEFIY